MKGRREGDKSINGCGRDDRNEELGDLPERIDCASDWPLSSGTSSARMHPRQV